MGWVNKNLTFRSFVFVMPSSWDIVKTNCQKGSLFIIPFSQMVWEQIIKMNRLLGEYFLDFYMVFKQTSLFLKLKFIPQFSCYPEIKVNIKNVRLSKTKEIVKSGQMFNISHLHLIHVGKITRYLISLIYWDFSVYIWKWLKRL